MTSLTGTGDNLRIIGFDLGHGETSAALCFALSEQAPRDLEIVKNRKVVMTVAVRDREGRIHIGADALNRVDPDQAVSHVRFKGAALSDPKTREPIAMFVERAVACLAERDPALAEGRGVTRFVVGCPSGWDTDTMGAYRRLLESAGMADVDVVRESRAAFVYALESDELKMTRGDLLGDVLIVDVGSSTTDFTFMRGLQEQVTDFGHNALGAGLFDEMLREHFERTHKDAKRIAKIFERYPVLRHKFEIKCRELKEAYFGDRQAREYFVIEGTPEILMPLEATEALMDSLLARKLDILDGQSWPQAMEAALKDVRRKIGNRDPRLVLATGGASRMDLVQKAVGRVFPDSEFLQSTEPEYTISRGLALAGRIQFKSDGMEAEISALAARGGALDRLVEETLSDLHRRIAHGIASRVTDDVLVPQVEAWNKGQGASINDLTAMIGAQARAWNGSPAARAVIQAAAVGWFEAVVPRIRELTDPIALKYGLRGDDLELSTEGFADVMPGVDVNVPGFESLDLIGAVVASSLAVMGLVALHTPVAFPIMVVAAIVAFVGGAAATNFFREWAWDVSLSGTLAPARWGFAALIKSNISGGKDNFAKRIEERMTRAYDWSRDPAAVSAALVDPESLADLDEEARRAAEEDMALASMSQVLVRLRETVLTGVKDSLLAKSKDVMHLLR
ncbi:MAG: Hsp70 family protein [Alphaproteobacteria bacterium]